MPGRFRSLARPRSYSGLLTMLVVVIVVSPLLDAVRFGARTLDVLFILALLSAIRDIAGDERRHHWVVGIGAVAVLGRLVSAVVQPPPTWIGIVSIGATMAVFLIATWSISRHVFREPSVTTDTIRGAICVYLLLGFIWTMAYVLVFASDPSAFPALIPAGDPAGTYASLQFFSFVTLTTLGYGDITPAGLVARQLAMAEAIVGQLFIAVAIAWLVGMYRGSGGDRDGRSEERSEDRRS